MGDHARLRISGRSANHCLAHSCVTVWSQALLGSCQPDAVSVCAVCILVGFLASASLLARHWAAIESWSAEEPAQAWADLEERLHPLAQAPLLDSAAEVPPAQSPKVLLLT